jgi:hypothetical protein
MIQKTMIAAVILMFVTGSVAFACSSCGCSSTAKAETASSAKSETTMKTEDVTFDGKIVCMGCDLKKTRGANADCSQYGCNHALKTSDGKYISLMKNKYSKDLMGSEKYAGKNISVTGAYYADANTVDVKSFKVDGKKMSWCNHCKSMDACMAQKGGM